jgi:hypothetical protein
MSRQAGRRGSGGPPSSGGRPAPGGRSTSSAGSRPGGGPSPGGGSTSNGGPSPASASTSDPMAGVERVFVDGSNLLFALGRRSAAGNVPAPPGAIVARLRAAFPPSVTIELVFDGPARGGITGRLATGLRVAYSGRATADQLIDEGVAAQLAQDGPAGTWGILVISDDRGLRELVTAKGARTAGTTWLAGRIGRVVEERPGGGSYRGSGGGSPGGPGSGAQRGPGGGPRRIAGAGGQHSGRRGHPNPPGPKAGTTIGHRRPPRGPAVDPRDP